LAKLVLVEDGEPLLRCRAPCSPAGNAVSAAMVTHWVCNVAIGQNFMAATANYGISTVYAFFGACSLVAAGYVSGNVPETKGKSFDQIQAEMDR
jgi:hypothetical protein